MEGKSGNIFGPSNLIKSEIYLFDYPLSAVDHQVWSEIFKILIKGLLMINSILATHQAQYLNQADKILVLAKGRQVVFGSF